MRFIPNRNNQQWELPRDGEPTLCFIGELLAKASSKSGSKESWTELALYRTAGGQYITQTIAYTTRDGWINWYVARVCVTAAETVDSFRNKKDRNRIGKLAMSMLAEADDDGINAVLDDIENAKERVK